jgi:hypothetical protein
MPSASFYQRAGLGGSRCISHLAYDVLPRLRLCQIEDELRLPERRVVAMSIGESGNHQSTLKVDDARLRANPSLNFGIGANGSDTIAAHRDRLRAWMLGVHGEQIAVKKDEVGTTLLGAGSRC